MYVAITGSGKYRVIQFREDKRIPGTNKKKMNVIETLGNYEKMLAKDPDVIVKLKEEARRRTLEKKESNAPLTASLSNQELGDESEVTQSYRFGHSVILKLWETLKLDKIFAKTAGKRDQQEVVDMIFYLLVHRLMDPASILACSKDQEDFAGLTEMKLDRLYDVLDVLDDSKEEIISHLAKFFEKNTNRESNRGYYDVTTYAFESTRWGELRMFGFSKDHKNNEVQVVMGLLIDNNGIPVTYELFPGNTMDQSTLIAAVERLRELYQMEKITIVADRGLNGGPNLEYLCNAGHDFVISYTLKRSSSEFKQLVWDEAGWSQIMDPKTGELLRKEKVVTQELKYKVPLTEEEIEHARSKPGRPRKTREESIPVKIHLTWTASRASKDYADRQRMLEKLRKKMDKPYQMKASLKRGVNQFLEMEMDTSGWKISEEKIRDAEQYDGYYAVITNNLALTTEEVTTCYHGLWKIEESFRVLKSDLEARPVYVHTDKHIRGHFVLCYLALCMVRYTQYLVVNHEMSPISAGVLMDTLEEPRVVVQGSFPDIILTPIQVSNTYLNLHRILGMKPLRKNMTLTQFRSITKVDLMENLK